MMSVSAVLLAAGESRRMGDINKLELLVDGIPLLRRTAEVLLASKLQEIVVVLGHQSDKAKEILAGLPLNLVTNKNYRDGQMTSVHQGLGAIDKVCDGVMVCLSDQPLLQSSDVDQLINAFGELDQEQTQSSILVPTYQGERGNPIIFGYQHRQKILKGERNLGCKKLIEKNPALVSRYEMNTNHIVVDLDTPEDYSQFTAEENKTAIGQ